jgi:hypothetical protein
MLLYEPHRAIGQRWGHLNDLIGSSEAATECLSGNAGIG